MSVSKFFALLLLASVSLLSAAQAGVTEQHCITYLNPSVSESLAYMDPSLEFMPAPKITPELAQEIGRQAQLVNYSAAEKLLGRQLSRWENLALKEAHLVGFGEPGRNGELAHIGNYTPHQNARKIRILLNAGFSKEEALALTDAGIVGNNKIGFFAELALRTFGYVDPKTGLHYNVRRSERLSNNGRTRLELTLESKSQGKSYVSEVIPIPNSEK